MIGPPLESEDTFYGGAPDYFRLLGRLTAQMRREVAKYSCCRGQREGDGKQSLRRLVQPRVLGWDVFLDLDQATGQDLRIHDILSFVACGDVRQEMFGLEDRCPDLAVARPPHVLGREELGRGEVTGPRHAMLALLGRPAVQADRFFWLVCIGAIHGVADR